MRLLKISVFVLGLAIGLTSIPLMTFVLVVMISLVAVWRWHVWRRMMND